MKCSVCKKDSGLCRDYTLHVSEAPTNDLWGGMICPECLDELVRILYGGESKELQNLRKLYHVSMILKDDAINSLMESLEVMAEAVADGELVRKLAEENEILKKKNEERIDRVNESLSLEEENRQLKEELLTELQRGRFCGKKTYIGDRREWHPECKACVRIHELLKDLGKL